MNDFSSDEENILGELYDEDPLMLKGYKQIDNFDAISAQVERRSISNLGVTTVHYGQEAANI